MQQDQVKQYLQGKNKITKQNNKMAEIKKTNNPEHFASASAKNLAISTKDCIEISNFLRYKNTAHVKSLLEEVISLKRAVPFKRFIRDTGHKAGMSAGKFPQKAAKSFLQLINSVEANAHYKGLNVSNLKITKLIANRASIPLTGGRRRAGTKRSHLEIEVKEMAVKEKKDKKKTVKKTEEKVNKQAVKEEVNGPKVEDKKVETKVEENKKGQEAEEVKEVTEQSSEAASSEPKVPESEDSESSNKPAEVKTDNPNEDNEGDKTK